MGDEEDSIIAVRLLIDRSEEDDIIRRALRFAFNDAKRQGLTNFTIAEKLGVEVETITRICKED